MTELKSLIQKEFFPTLLSYDFVVYKNNLIIKPVNNLLRGFCFDRHDNQLYVHLFIQPLYVPSTYQNLSYGWRLKGVHSLGDMFLLDDNQLECTKAEIRSLLLSQKDILLAINTALDFHNRFLISNLKLLAHKTEVDIRHQETLTLTQSFIYPEKTCILVDDFLERWERDDRNHIPWMREIQNNMLLLKHCCTSNDKILELFAKWRSTTIEKLRLTKIK